MSEIILNEEISISESNEIPKQILGCLIVILHNYLL